MLKRVRQCLREGKGVYSHFCGVHSCFNEDHQFNLGKKGFNLRTDLTNNSYTRDKFCRQIESRANRILQETWARRCGQKVAGWLHGQISLLFCREIFNSGVFFLAIFSPVALPVQGWLHMRFSSRAGNSTKFEKIASPA